MDIAATHRGSRTVRTQDSLLVKNGGRMTPQKKWTNLMPLIVALVIIAEIAFLGRLEIVKNAVVDSLTDLINQSPPSLEMLQFVGDSNYGSTLDDDNVELESCEEWLEREDAVAYSRDFGKEPILVYGAEKEWKSCSVGCEFGFGSDKKPDAAFGLEGGRYSVIRSMESAKYFPENDIAYARRQGYSVIMTTSLSSDVPVGYFSWAEYDVMEPVQPKTEKSLAVAFISNCGALNFRLQALEALEKQKVKIDSYGRCHRTHDGQVDKVETLKKYKFSLAFENSNEEDYVTEKFFQSLVAGTIPVVVGAPNIEDFAPSPGSILHIKELADVELVAKVMKHLSENPDAYNRSMRWKYEGPSDSFKALVDMAAVHSSCRLCIHLATLIRDKEETSPAFKKRPCKCVRGSETIYHLFVRERGRFDFESIFLRSGNMSLEALRSAVVEKFSSRKHIPVWKEERPESIRGGDELKLHRIYPVGLTQRQALYTFRFGLDSDLRNHVENTSFGKCDEPEAANASSPSPAIPEFGFASSLGRSFHTSNLVSIIAAAFLSST